MRRVAQTDLYVSVLSFGCSPIGEIMGEVEPAEALKALEAGHRLGIRHFDTAPWYGNGCSEIRTGVGLNAAKRAGRPYSLSTKVGRILDPAPRKTEGPWDGLWGPNGCDLQVRYDYTHDSVLQQHRESCLRMGLPRVDALAIHDLDAMFGGQELVEKYLGQLRPPGGLKALQDLKARGEVKAIGIGCNPFKFGSREVCTAVADLGPLDYIILAGPYNLANQEALDNLLPFCEERGISVFIGAAYASGILAYGHKGKGPAFFGGRPIYMYEPASDEMLEKVAKIEAVCEKHSVALTAAALQFPLAHPCVASVLVGMKSEAEVLQAVDAMDADIPAQFWQELRSEGLIRSDAPVPGVAP